ncbi:hypothetical protein GCM10028825_52220 [Spirosoma agri]
MLAEVFPGFTGAQFSLFKYSDWIGGRPYIITISCLPHVKADIGDMQYISDPHILTALLVGQFELQR